MIMARNAGRSGFSFNCEMVYGPHEGENLHDAGPDKRSRNMQ